MIRGNCLLATIRTGLGGPKCACYVVNDLETSVAENGSFSYTIRAVPGPTCGGGAEKQVIYIDHESGYRSVYAKDSEEALLEKEKTRLTCPVQQ